MNAPRTLIGNTFPLSLIRRRVVITLEKIESLRERLATAPPASFWGHKSTLAQANRLVQADLTPEQDRPAMALDAAGLPRFNGQTFSECWVLSPDFRPGYRPQPNVEVPPADITGWQVLRLSWDEEGGPA